MEQKMEQLHSFSCFTMNFTGQTIYSRHYRFTEHAVTRLTTSALELFIKSSSGTMTRESLTRKTCFPSSSLEKVSLFAPTHFYEPFCSSLSSSTWTLHLNLFILYFKTPQEFSLRHVVTRSIFEEVSCFPVCQQFNRRISYINVALTFFAREMTLSYHLIKNILKL